VVTQLEIKNRRISKVSNSNQQPQPPNKRFKTFISHKKSSGRYFALLIQLELKHRDPLMEIFLDVDHLKVITIEELQKMIEDSETLLLLITENVEQSDWVKKEVAYALQLKKKIILLQDMVTCSGFFAQPDLPSPFSTTEFKLHPAIPWVDQYRNQAVDDILKQIK